MFHNTLFNITFNNFRFNINFPILNICYYDLKNTVKLGYNEHPAITNNMSSLGWL